MSDKIKRSEVDDINRRNNAADSYKNRSFGNKKRLLTNIRVREFFIMLISILMKSNQTLTTLFR